MQASFLLFPILAIITAIVGSHFTREGMNWYSNVRKPSWTPSGKIIGAVWSFIFMLFAVSGIITWQADLGIDAFFIGGLFITNALLNILWCYIFFKEHQTSIAIFEAGALGVSVLALMVAIWPFSVLGSLILLPYLLWVSFATFLTHQVWKLNTNWKWSSL